MTGVQTCALPILSGLLETVSKLGLDRHEPGTIRVSIPALGMVEKEIVFYLPLSFLRYWEIGAIVTACPNPNTTLELPSSIALSTLEQILRLMDAGLRMDLPTLSQKYVIEHALSLYQAADFLGYTYLKKLLLQTSLCYQVLKDQPQKVLLRLLRHSWFEDGRAEIFKVLTDNLQHSMNTYLSGDHMERGRKLEDDIDVWTLYYESIYFKMLHRTDQSFFCHKLGLPPIVYQQERDSASTMLIKYILYWKHGLI